MTTPSLAELIKELQDYFAEEFGLEDNLTPDLDIFEQNLLDSMDVLNIIVHLDETYSFKTDIYAVSLKTFLH